MQGEKQNSLNKKDPVLQCLAAQGIEFDADLKKSITCIEVSGINKKNNKVSQQKLVKNQPVLQVKKSGKRALHAKRHSINFLLTFIEEQLASETDFSEDFEEFDGVEQPVVAIPELSDAVPVVSSDSVFNPANLFS